MRVRIPYEHEKKAERAMRVVRERIRVKIRELPFKLHKKLYDALAAECIRNINLMPNSKSMPHSPVELVKGDKVNYLTDLSPSFGSLVLCPTYGNQHSRGSEAKQEMAICLGSTDMKGGVLVYIPGRENPVVRRNIKPLAMTTSMIDYMNKWSETLPGFEDSEFVFKDTIALEATRHEDFNRDSDVRHLSGPEPDNSEYHRLLEVDSESGGVTTNEQYATGGERDTRGGITLSPTLVDISYNVDTTETSEIEPIVSDDNVINELPRSSPAKSPIKSSGAGDHVKKKYGREQHLDPTAIIGSSEKRSTRSRGDVPKVFQMSLRKAIQSETRDAAIEAAKKELKQLVDLKTWVYLKE